MRASCIKAGAAGYGWSVARVEITVDGSAADVYAVLANPDTYPDWLVGAREIRSTDDAFPVPGSRFRHRVGVGPVEVKDETVSLQAREGERLVLRAKARPFGQAVVRFDLHGSAGGTRVVMDETVVEPAALRRLAFLIDPITAIRNRASLRHLKDLVEGRS